MKVIIYALLLLLGAVGFGLWNSAPSAGPAQLEGYQNLKFTDQRGPGCTEEEKYFFTTFVNDASTFYRNDYRNSLGFTSSELEKMYNKKFSVIVQNYSSSTTNSYLVSSNGEYAGIAAGSDLLFANNSFLMVANTPQTGVISRNFLQKPGDAGSGLDESKKKIIDNIIISLEGSSCRCTGVSQMSIKLTRFDGEKWNVVCFYYSYMMGQVWSKNSTYYYAHPQNCYYLVWIPIE